MLNSRHEHRRRCFHFHRRQHHLVVRVHEYWLKNLALHPQPNSMNCATLRMAGQPFDHYRLRLVERERERETDKFECCMVI